MAQLDDVINLLFWLIQLMGMKGSQDKIAWAWVALTYSWVRELGRRVPGKLTGTARFFKNLFILLILLDHFFWITDY